MSKLSAYQVFSGAGAWKGLTTDNHLSKAFFREPEKLSKNIIRIAERNWGSSIDTLLNKFPTREFENDEPAYWDIISSEDRNIPLVEARDEFGQVVTAASDNVGAGTQPFELVFPQDWFSKGEYIVGHLNELYQFRIIGEPRMEGTNAVYRVELAGGNTLGVPAERLLPGERFSIEAAYVAREMSREVSELNFSAPSRVFNEWSVVRISHTEPGTNVGKKIAMGIPVVKGGKVQVMPYWMSYVEYQLEKKFARFKANALLYGRSSRNPNGEYKNVDENGGIIKTGAGLYEQMEASNTVYYNAFSIKLLTNTLMDIALPRFGMQDRYVVIRTGERGAAQFSEAVTREVSGWTQFVINGDQIGVVGKTSSMMHSNSLKAGFQFTEFLAPNGLRVRVEVDEMYDDPVRNKILHPLGGVAMSYRYDIFDFGTSEEANIIKCRKKGEPEKHFGYQWGPFGNPFTGELNNNNAFSDRDVAKVHAKATLSICALDPQRMVAIIPAQLRG